MSNVTFYPFPKPSVDLRRCLYWIQQCAHSSLSAEKIGKHHYVCSKHFPDGAKDPVLAWPLPTPTVDILNIITMDAPEGSETNVKDNPESYLTSETGVKRPLCDVEEDIEAPPEKRSKSEADEKEEVIEEKQHSPNSESVTKPEAAQEEHRTQKSISDYEPQELTNSIKTELIAKSEEKNIDYKVDADVKVRPEQDLEASDKEIKKAEDLSLNVKNAEEMEMQPENTCNNMNMFMSDKVKDIDASLTDINEVKEKKDECMQDDQSNTKDDDVKENIEENGTVKSDNDMSSSQESEKENMEVDAPMDLTRKTPTSNGQDIIMLSDEDEDPKRFTGDRELSLQELKLKQRMIKRLQAELRNEEAKLVLLKKLRFSQIAPQVNDNLQRKTPTNNSAQPPPLVRGNQPPVPMKPANIQAPQQPQRAMGNALNKSQGPPPLVMAPKVDQRQLEKQMKLLQEHQIRQRQAVPTNQQQQQQQANLAGFRGTQAQADALRQLQQVQQRAAEETPEKRQAAAKLALRKQLEKTLLQIPPPKPPPPEMNFIPSLASPDFIYLLGLEEAVNFIIDTNLISKGKKSPDEKMVCNPFTCVQCGTDFTPVWKREKPGSKNVICEQCVTSNQKKALKQEHTNRLKNAFVKALQQEQEIERMQSQELKATASAVTLSSSSSSSSLKEKAETRERDARDASARDASARNAAAVQNAAAQAQAYKESMESLRQQHQNLVQAHQAAALRMGQPLGLQFNPRGPFPYQLPFARASDLQRQYLLDMIPKGGLPWNS
ncbi:transcriptional repressor p66-beta-like isoform X1 [Dreissena polymorpha]|nr:transcriptional repressor p66-beta-like isoform X1 [Dreissena polymorpha]